MTAELPDLLDALTPGQEWDCGVGRERVSKGRKALEVAALQVAGEPLRRC